MGDTGPATQVPPLPARDDAAGTATTGRTIDDQPADWVTQDAQSPDAPSISAPTARRDFGLLWTGQSISLMGDQFVFVGLPLMAVTTLGVPAAEAALLPFAFKLPFLVLGLPAGAILDRVRRRPVLLSSEFVYVH